MMKIRITPGALLLCLVLAAGRNPLLPAALAAAAVHECGHLFAARALGIRLRLLELDLFGARLTPAGPLPSYRAEAWLAAAGPLSSLLLALPLLGATGGFPAACRASTLSFALFNLLPIEGFDGGRVLSALLSSLFGAGPARAALRVTSYLSLLFLFALSACLLLRFGQNAELGVLAASLFARLFLPEEGRARRSGRACRRD